MTPEASAMIRNLPAELRAVRQWCIAGADRAPYVVIGGQVLNASLHKPEQWKSFEEAVADATLIGNGAGVGFMLTTEDPWACIDLDVVNEITQRRKGRPVDPSKWTTPAEIERYQKIVSVFGSYTERSSSGFGLHIWVRGFIGAGARRDGVEVYSQERFIVCTGDELQPGTPIVEAQESLEQLVFEIRSQGSDIRAELEEVEPDDTDMEVFEKASTAANAEKFNALCAGKWKELGFPSQSEADLALMSIFTFYSRSNSQCRQLFRCTALGQREKATKNDRYLNFTLEVIRGRQKREQLVTEASRKLAEDYVKTLVGGATPADVSAGKLAVAQAVLPNVASTIDWPPGVAGAIADFIYRSSPRPVKEVAIVATIGFLAGVCGKSYNIHQSGLNAYMILVARSGVGKEAMHSGLSLIMEEMRNSIPAAQKFVDFTDYVSGPALKKACAMNPSFVNVVGEFGRKLKRFSEDKADGPVATLRTAMTDLYQKSGATNMVGGMGYSDKEKDVSSITGVAYSMIGETTPGTFYEALTQGMMEDGFLSRFTIVDYNGDRPPANHEPERRMTPALAQALHGLCAQSLTLLSKFANQPVTYSPEAGKMLHDFDLECDGEINGTLDEAKRQMWNRAHLKVCRTAALLAVADAPPLPVVYPVHVEWALKLIRRDIHIMSSRINSGDVGTDDVSRERKMHAMLKVFLESASLPESYGVPDNLKKANIVPKRYLQIRLSRVPCYMNVQGGATRALDSTIRSLIEGGYLAEVLPTELSEKFAYHGKAYRVLSLLTH
jgi:hypothetical protein